MLYIFIESEIGAVEPCIDCRESAYAVNIDGEKCSCECKGFASHGHCKHSDGIAALIAAGKL